MALSKFVLRPEDVSVRVTGYNEWFNRKEALRYDLDKLHRALWASTKHNLQLRELSADMGLRCQWWAGYYDYVMTACQAAVCHLGQNSDRLQPLLAQLVTMAMQLKPDVPDVQLFQPVLIQQHGSRAFQESFRKQIEADYVLTWHLKSAVARQNALLASYIELQQFHAKQVRELCSTRRVAGLLQALAGQYQLTDLLPADAILTALRFLFAGRRTHGYLGFETEIDAETVAPAATAVPSAEPPSMAPPAAGASVAVPPIQLATYGPIAQDLALSSVAGSYAPVTINGRLTVSLDDEMVDATSLEFAKVFDLPVLGPSNLTLTAVAMPEVTLPNLGSLPTSDDSWNAGAQHLALTVPPFQLATYGPIAQDLASSSVDGSCAPVTINGRLTVSLDKQFINKVIKMTAFPHLCVPRVSLDLLQACFKEVDGKSLGFVKVFDLPVLGPNSPAQLTLTDVAVQDPGNDSVNAGAQHQDVRDICRDNEAAITGISCEAQPKDSTLPGPTIKSTTVKDLPGSDNLQEEHHSNTTSSWRRRFCVRFGKTMAATGVAVACMLLKRHRVLERL